MNDDKAAALEIQRLDAPVQARLVEEVHSGRTLVRVLARRLLRRAGWSDSTIRPVVSYGGLVVMDRSNLHGGGLGFGMDYPRALLELGIGRVPRMFEFCAGPGYIGYYLLSLGFCDSLVLADVNPAAVEAASRTLTYNGLADRVTVYTADVLDGIPDTERWDLVVGNPPHFDRSTGDIRTEDRGWALHERFYAGVGRFMRPGGRVVMVENHDGSRAEEFVPMIERGGGRVGRVIDGRDGLGRPDGYYFLESIW